MIFISRFVTHLDGLIAHPVCWLSEFVDCLTVFTPNPDPKQLPRSFPRVFREEDHGAFLRRRRYWFPAALGWLIACGGQGVVMRTTVRMIDERLSSRLRNLDTPHTQIHQYTHTHKGGKKATEKARK